MRAAGLSLSLGWFCLSAAPAGAQGVSVRLGGVEARYADTLAAAAAAASLHGTLQRGAVTGGLDLAHARFASGDGSSTQATLNLTLAGSRAPTRLAGFRATATTSFLSGGTYAWTASGEAFAAWMRGAWLATATAAGGGVRDISGTTRPTARASAGARRQLGPAAIEARAAGTWSRSIQFADLTTGLEWRRGRLVLGAAAGARLGDLGDEALLQAHAEVTLVPSVSLEAAAGSFPHDLTGFTSGRFVTAGLRIALAREPAAPTDSRLRVEVLAGDSARVTFDVPDAGAVAIVGEWNQWQPAPLTRVAGGRWQAVLPLPRGAWRFQLVIDGGRWVVPPGVPRLPDDFGGEVGVLVIEG